MRFMVRGARFERSPRFEAQDRHRTARRRTIVPPITRNAHSLPLAPASTVVPRTANLPDSGLTLVELIITVAIVGILASAALPMARFEVKRQKERELRRDLWEMRDAIDRYKDAADRGGIQVKADSLGYPPDLQTLVDGVDVQDKKVRFLRAIPTDPMTKTTDWGMRSNQDDADSDSWGGQNLFDVFTKSEGTALDGTKYNTW
jgi:general secretion pathway protein G